MKSRITNTVGMCFFVCALAASCPADGVTKTGGTGLTEPVTTVSIVRQPEGYSSEGHEAAVTVKPTDPVTLYTAIPEPTRPATDPVTTKSRNPGGANTTVSIVRQPEGYSSEGHDAAITVKPTDPVTLYTANPEPTRPATDPVTTRSRVSTGGRFTAQGIR